jgi:hypothetical protein
MCHFIFLGTILNIDIEHYFAKSTKWLVSSNGEVTLLMTIFPFPLTSAFITQFPLHFGQEEVQKIFNWSIIQRQFISAFHLTASKGSWTGKTSLPLICGSVLPPASLHGSDTGNVCFYSLRTLYHIVLLNLEIWH